MPFTKKDIEYEKKCKYVSFEKKQIKTQSDSESAVSKIKTELEPINEEEPMKVSGWVLDKITSRQLEMYKTNSITGRTYVKLLINN